MTPPVPFSSLDEMRFLGLLTRRATRRAVPVALGVLVLGGVLAVDARTADVRSMTLISTGPFSGNGPLEPAFAAASADGTRVVFVTEEQLVAGDTDLSYDAYERAGEATTLLSIGPNGGNAETLANMRSMTRDGSRIFFETAESLLEADTDSVTDVYERAGAALTLVSVGPAGGNGPEPAFLDRITPDGTRAYFRTEEQLLAGDTDEELDVYRRHGETLTRISTGPGGGDGAAGVQFLGAADDGSVAFFWTNEQLVAADTDGWYDIYARAEGQTARVSTGPNGGNGPINAIFAGNSPDGSRAFFRTVESLVPEDTDTVQDVYLRAEGETTLVSVGPEGGNGTDFVLAAGHSADGSHVFFETQESLLAADSDSESDLYQWAEGVTNLVSTGPSWGNGPFDAEYLAASTDGSRVLFETAESLLEADTDSVTDIYERAGADLTLVSVGPAGGNGGASAYFGGISAAGDRVFFESVEPLLPSDTDSERDVYRRVGGTVELISLGSAEVAAFFLGSSEDGGISFVSTTEALSAADTDPTADIYRSSIEPQPEPGPPVPGPGPNPVPVSPGQNSTPLPTSPPKCKGAKATLIGSSRGETLRGTSKRDVIVAFGGADRIFGKGGKDLICAGAGNDLLRGGDGADALHGQGGKDRLFGGAGRDVLKGGPGKDTQRQ